MNASSLLFRSTLIASALTGIIAISSCTPYQQQGAVLGTLGGAAVGAVAGDDRGDVLTGAIVGGAAGTGIAALKEQNDRNRGYYNSGGDHSPQHPPTPPTSQPRTNYPTATKTDNPNLVVSPYKPHNVIDIRGFQSGQLAKDPSNNQIFRIP